MSNTYHNTSEGKRRKRDALDLLAAHRAVYVRRGRRALLARLLDVGEATADDVRDAVQLPPNIRPVTLGAVPGLLAEAGIIRPSGFAITRRAEAHARPIRIWALADRAAALEWLAAHPDLPEDAPQQRDLYDGIY